MRDVCARARPDVALANHLVMGPAIVARGLGGDAPYAVKVHGSALEYVVKRDPARFLPWAREGLAGARGVLVGSRHTGESLFAAMQDDGLPERTRLGPPGVDVDEFRPRDDAAAGVEALIERLAASEDDAGEGAFARDASAAASALRRLDLVHDRHVCFIGKLIVSKGIDLLLAAWPLVPEARLVVIGFGGFRDGLVAPAGRAGRRRPRGACARSRRPGASSRAARERRCATCWPSSRPPTTSTGPRRATCASAWCSPGAWSTTSWRRCWPAARRSSSRAPSPRPTGWWPPRRRPAACCPSRPGTPGAAEVSAMLAAAVPAAGARLAVVRIDDGAVRAIAERVTRLAAGAGRAARATRAALVATAHARFSWEGVAGGVIAAAQGDLAELPPVA